MSNEIFFFIMFSFFGSIDFNPINIKIVKIKSLKKNTKNPPPQINQNFKPKVLDPHL